MEADAGNGAGGNAWELLEDRRRLLVEALEADHHLTQRANGRGGKKAQARKCQRCSVRGEPEALPCPADLRSCGYLSVTSWAYALRALQTPHCPNCGTITPRPSRGIFGNTRDAACRIAAGAPLSWNVNLSPCLCCGQQLASDAIACVRCGTTSPRGGYLVQPRLQRCARCGAQVASDAGLCVSCGTASFRPASLFNSGPSDLRLVGCLRCGREIAADALLCVHCGSAWPVLEAEPLPGDDSNCSKEGHRGQRRWLNASEALEAAEARSREQTAMVPRPHTQLTDYIADTDRHAEEISMHPTSQEGGEHPLRVMAEHCEQASAKLAATWDGFFETAPLAIATSNVDGDNVDDGRGLGFARRAG